MPLYTRNKHGELTVLPKFPIGEETMYITNKHGELTALPKFPIGPGDKDAGDMAAGGPVDIKPQQGRRSYAKGRAAT